MDNMASGSLFNERIESLPSVGSRQYGLASDKLSQKNPAEDKPSEQLEEAEQDAADPTHEKEVPPENEKSS
jgi:hypothetical protein